MRVTTTFQLSSFPSHLLFHLLNIKCPKRSSRLQHLFYGRSYHPPSQYQLRESLLKEEVERTKGLFKKQEEEWAQNGCSVITDEWSVDKSKAKKHNEFLCEL
ncbi:hypothetical protein CTI12_AA574430 [Artemisia annua]|uniref:DUF659 domain-containing protein n=1 Tax=Artemisia annua TaxID=35608 RepID=A0A2U1KR16_ARTAN|nr:hypothetical protein CTI12_AA574430 [Artemisia annua]